LAGSHLFAADLWIGMIIIITIIDTRKAGARIPT
jgi:hypothetical protein